MLRPLVVLLAFGLTAKIAWTQTCVDVRAVDFRNAAIRTGAADANEAGLLFGGAAPLTDGFELRRGVALLRDDPEAAGSAPDWRVELVTDRKIHAGADTWVRVLLLEENHLSGTGMWEVVLAYACERGKLVRLFQFSGEGVSLMHLDAEKLQLYQALWKPSDPHCCPSRHVELTYAWDAETHRYRRGGAVVRDGFVSVTDER